MLVVTTFIFLNEVDQLEAVHIIARAETVQTVNGDLSEPECSAVTNEHVSKVNSHLIDSSLQFKKRYGLVWSCKTLA